MLCLDRALANSVNLPEKAVLFLNLSMLGLEYIESEAKGLFGSRRRGRPVTARVRPRDHRTDLCGEREPIEGDGWGSCENTDSASPSTTWAPGTARCTSLPTFSLISSSSTKCWFGICRTSPSNATWSRRSSVSAAKAVDGHRRGRRNGSRGRGPDRTRHRAPAGLLLRLSQAAGLIANHASFECLIHRGLPADHADGRRSIAEEFNAKSQRRSQRNCLFQRERFLSNAKANRKFSRSPGRTKKLKTKNSKLDCTG